MHTSTHTHWHAACLSSNDYLKSISKKHQGIRQGLIRITVNYLHVRNCILTGSHPSLTPDYTPSFWLLPERFPAQPLRTLVGIIPANDVAVQFACHWTPANHLSPFAPAERVNTTVVIAVFPRRQHTWWSFAGPITLKWVLARLWRGEGTFVLASDVTGMDWSSPAMMIGPLSRPVPPRRESVYNAAAAGSKQHNGGSQMEIGS